MRVANVALLDSFEARLVRTNCAYSISQPTCIRMEPAFIFCECTLSLSILNSDETETVQRLQLVDRNTVAVFEEIPSLTIGRHTVRVCIDGDVVMIFMVDVRQAYSEILSAALKENQETNFYRKRYLTQSLPFREMLRCTREDLDRVAAKLVFVTGSVGKTTTKELISFLLLHEQDLIHSTDSWNFPHEICSQIRNNVSWCRAFVMEAALGRHLPLMGKLLPPDVFVFTEIGKAHTAFEPDLEKLADLKVSLAAHMRPGSVIIANMANTYIRRAVENLDAVRTGAVRLIGISAAACEPYDITVVLQDGKGFVRDRTQDAEFPIRTNHEALADTAVSCAYASWLEFHGANRDFNKFQKCIEYFPSVPGRLESVRIGRIEILDDSYNANPLSMKRFISRLNTEKMRGRRTFVIVGEMHDLGQISELEHAHVAAELSKIADRIIFVGKRYKGLATSHNAECISLDDISKLERVLLNLAGDYDVFAFKASYATGLIRLVQKFRTAAAVV